MDDIVYVFPYEGHQAIFVPAGEVTIEFVKANVVPAGVPFRIFLRSEIPPSEEQENWQVDYSNPDGYGEAV